jgi:ABC-type Fe3+ transport system permease subunit
MRRVVIPAARPGIVAGGTLAAVTFLGEFVVSVLLYTQHNRPIAIEILAQLRGFSLGTAAAYSLLLIVVSFVLTIAARFFEARFARGEGMMAAQ